MSESLSAMTEMTPEACWDLLRAISSAGSP